MPGICGLITPGSSSDLSLPLERMRQALTGDVGDQKGLYADASLKLGVAWKPDSGFFNGCGLTWNAEQSVGLLLAGRRFDEDSSGSTWIHAYETGGWAFLEKLNGWFVGVLIDRRQRLVALFGDRYGLCRLYYHEGPRGLSFSTEAKTLLALAPELRRFEERSLGEWLSCGCVLQHRTLFAGVHLLPPGALWVFPEVGAVSKRSYFDARAWEAQPTLAPQAYYERLRAVFPRILGRYFQGGRARGMSLTGGLDGRLMLAWAGSRKGELPCYTFNGPFRDCADVKLARRVAAACGQPHQTIPVDDDFLSQFAELAQETVTRTDGAMDVTGAVELYANRLARQIAPVRLTGNYGSEILRRYVAFRPRGFPASLLCGDLTARTQDAARTYAEEARGNPLSFIAFKQVPWHHFARFAVERSEVEVRSPYLDNELVELAFQAPPEGTGLDLWLNFIVAGNPALGRIPTDRGIVHPASQLGNAWRRHVAEFLTKAEYAYDYGMPNWLARLDSRLRALRLERLFLGRQKFCHFRHWYRHQLGPYVRQVLLDPASLSRPYLDRGAIERLVAGHLAGRENWTVEIHKLLSLELLQRTLLRGG